VLAMVRELHPQVFAIRPPFALNATRFLVCCPNHHVQTMLGVTRVVVVSFFSTAMAPSLTFWRKTLRTLLSSLWVVAGCQKEMAPVGGPPSADATNQ
jgi:hypothetical protein